MTTGDRGGLGDEVLEMDTLFDAPASSYHATNSRYVQHELHRAEK